MQSVDAVSEDTENRRIVKRNLKLLCLIAMFDVDTEKEDNNDYFSKYDDVLRKSESESVHLNDERRNGVDKKSSVVVDVFANCNNDDDDDDNDNDKKKDFEDKDKILCHKNDKSKNIFRNCQSDIENQPSSTSSSLSHNDDYSISSMLASSGLSSSKRESKKWSPSSRGNKSKKKLDYDRPSNDIKVKRSDVFDSDEVIDTELNSIVPTNRSNGKKSKKVLSSFLGNEGKLLTEDDLQRSKETKKKIGKRGNVRKHGKRIRTPIASSPSVMKYLIKSKRTHKTVPSSIEELLKAPPKECDTSISSPAWNTLAEMTEELKKIRRLSRQKDVQCKQDRKHKEGFLAENEANRDKLNANLTKSKIKEWIHDNKQYIQDIWDGKIESKRYMAFHKSTEAKNGLLYHMITHPFSETQLEIVLQEITEIWMNTPHLLNQHSDFVWKVILPETFIKLYADFFDISKNEAEKRISSTPLRSDDEDHVW